MERPASAVASPAILYGVLAVGIAAIGAAAIFIRLADADAMTIAAMRMSVAAVAVGGLALLTARHQFAAIERRDVPWLALSGVLLAAHFGTWVTSLQLTSVANSVFLVTTTPIFVALGAQVLLRERVGVVMAAALVLSLGGGLVLALGSERGDTHLGGDALALAGAVAMAGVLLVGRHVRWRIPLLPYVSIVYGVAALLLLASAGASGATFTGLGADAYLWMVLAGLVPQTIGHSALNWALAHASAAMVAMSTRAEPVIATLLAIPVLGEWPGWVILPGGVLLFLGVGLAARSEAAGR